MSKTLIIGIIDVIVGLALFVLCIILNRTERIVFTFFPVAVGLGTIAGYIHERKQHCWRNPTKKEMVEISKNCRCCTTCTHVEFNASQIIGTIRCVCTWNRVRPIIEKPTRHACPNWRYGSGHVVIERQNGTRIYFK